MRLEGKVSLVTGGGGGIGRAIAIALATAGAQVVISGRRIEALEETAAAVKTDPPIRYFVADIIDRVQVNKLIAWTRSQCGPIDILVNNAGINIPDRSLATLTPENWDRLMQVNASGAFYLVHAALPAMRARRSGLIINISSMAGVRASVVSGAAYTAAKHALCALSRVISLEEKDNGIRATNICPGEVDTPILDERPEPVSDEHRAQILQPEDVAAAVLFVASLPPRAHVPELYIKPTTHPFS